MDYLKWSQEYYEEAQKILRNIERLRDKLRSSTVYEKRSTEDKITKLRLIYYECIHTANYLQQKAKQEVSNAA